MYSGGSGARGSRLMVVIMLVMAGLLMILVAGCGGGEAEDSGSQTTAAPSGSAETTQGGGGEGTALAEEILATFDALVAEVAAAAKDNPEPAVLKPQLDTLYESYMPKMTELNTKYLALRDADIAEFGACNTYLGENRGKHVTDKDNTLTEPVKHYNLDLGDQEMVALLSQKPVELLEVAVKQN